MAKGDIKCENGQHWIELADGSFVAHEDPRILSKRRAREIVKLMLYNAAKECRIGDVEGLSVFDKDREAATQILLKMYNRFKVE